MHRHGRETPPQRADAPADPVARRPEPPVIAFQRAAGNAAVARMLSARRVLQRMAVDTATIDPETLSAEEARRYLGHWEKSTEASIKLTVTPEDVVVLVRRSLAAHEATVALADARKALDEVPARLIPLLKGSPSHKGAADEIEREIASANEREKAVLVDGWRGIVAQRQRAELERVVLRSLRVRLQIVDQVNAKVRRLAKSLGLPALDEATVKEFKALEAIKARSRTERAPLDELLARYVARVSAIIPGASLVYRGSVARGVKSPSKFVETADGDIALASFDAPGVYKAEPRKAEATGPAEPSYDVDANIEIPDKKMRELRLQSGPLSRNAPGSPVVKELLQLQAEIDADIKKTLKATMPRLDTESPFEFYLSSAGGKAEAQLATGTPYPPYMLENAGFPKLAATLPTAYAAELANKVVEYFTQHMVVRGTSKVKPLGQWEPYFAELYTHIKAKGPQAVFMPEVQVDLTAKREYTQSAQPANTGEYTGPVDLIAANRYTLIKPATGPGDVTPGALLHGRLSKIVTPRDKKPFAFVDLGGGQEAICFSFGGAEVDSWSVCRVTAAAVPPKKAAVQWSAA